MLNICCIGHITLDKVITPHNTVHMAGGTSYYFSKALQLMDVNYGLVTSLGNSEMPVVEKLRSQGTPITAFTSAHSVYFENSYSANQDQRTQRVLQKADAFSIDQLQDVEAEIFHLGPLLADDMSLDVIKYLAGKGRLSLDAQGYLREVRNLAVHAVDWPQKQEALQYISILKVNEHELEALTGETDIKAGALILANWGVKEVVITLGSMGSVIYTDGVFYNVPAYIPDSVTDATGCGDTYMAGYLFKRVKGADIQEAGEFAAAMASIKIANSGAFTGTEADVMNFLAVKQD
ncbi:PfkB family carbohydrate kinase [Mucilaginibacter terrae]|uniref:Sugar/nucleoside kinase (Ribokinase family) n=1 Tax=Mucilaginibacter terrae TaxID=1955052 RepID=A0ABU3GWN1_9SPHI|nr:PfkB family carbohydrate kinase [Mucilaginibacter terrae]MDT3404021.1 sugar/nucleoside kinase (ribokinase family) [Mucilaginibacter terrae]